MSNWKDLINLEKDEKVIKVFSGGLEFAKGDKAHSGTFVLTNQNLTFYHKEKGEIFTTPIENILSVQKGRTRHKSLLILLENADTVRFFPKENTHASANALCVLITKQLSKTNRKPMGTPSQHHPSVKEIIREKEVIIKIRCPYCRNTFDERLDKCPHCGGHT